MFVIGTVTYLDLKIRKFILIVQASIFELPHPYLSREFLRITIRNLEHFLLILSISYDTSMVFMSSVFGEQKENSFLF
ncbi:hypothetical protein CAEBREN_28266 [Caenorhabditis brenneri]|uniref:Uncharacterized protein n=1 Tax=Caenorhabditis brenneri TaxID=135651 RepID=G0MK15_CAEBE|nr:hypothetical protein CAEBREN_28266 [Caenorhabditis brenneri]